MAFGALSCAEKTFCPLASALVSTSHRYATSAFFMRRPKFSACTVPRPFSPTTATTSRSFGEPRVRISGPVEMAPKLVAAALLRNSRRDVAIDGNEFGVAGNWRPTCRNDLAWMADQNL